MTIDVSPYRAPHGIQIDTKGLLYVVCDLDRKLLVIDPKKRAIRGSDRTTKVRAIGSRFLPDASKAYVTNKEYRPFVSVIDLKQRKIVGRIPVAGGTEGIAASPDGKRIVVMAHAEPTMIVIDSATDAVVDRIALKDQGRGAYKVYYSPECALKVLTMNLGARLMNVFDAANLKKVSRRFLPNRQRSDGVRLLSRRKNRAGGESRRRDGDCGGFVKDAGGEQF